MISYLLLNLETNHAILLHYGFMDIMIMILPVYMREYI